MMFHSQYEKWMNGPLLEVNAEDVEEEVSIILVGLYGVINSERLVSCSTHSMRRVFLFVLILNIPVNNFPVMSGLVFLG